MGEKDVGFGWNLGGVRLENEQKNGKGNYTLKHWKCENEQMGGGGGGKSPKKSGFTKGQQIDNLFFVLLKK